jgi:hypothetical protein
MSQLGDFGCRLTLRLAMLSPGNVGGLPRLAA